MNAWNRGPTGHDSPASLVATAVTTLTLAVAFGGLALGVDGWWIAFPVGFGAVMPLAVGLAGSLSRDRGGSGADETGDGDDSAVDALRERYARGEIDEAEFEDRVERLLETERGGGR